jgi:hypothetical protein
MKTCIVNFAKGLWFPKGQTRLVKSIRESGYHGTVMLFGEESDVGAPSHEDVHYGFKPYSILAAKNAGFDLVLWLDTSMRATSNLQPAFDCMMADGLYLWQCDGIVGEWSSDKCLESFGVTRESAMNIRECGSGAIGFNFNHWTGLSFFNNVMQHLADFQADWTNDQGQVSTDPRVKGHRHDQTVISLVRHQMGLDVMHQRKVFESCLVCLGADERKADADWP